MTLFMVYKLQIVLLFKPVPDASFANAKAVSAFFDTNLKLMMKMMDKSHART